MSCRIYRWLKQFYLKRSDLKLENTYICNKKKEFGKWLMDIAKYITTAVILSSMIGDIREKGYLYTIAFILVAVSLGWGLYLVRDKQKKGKQYERRYSNDAFRHRYCQYWWGIFLHSRPQDIRTQRG